MTTSNHGTNAGESAVTQLLGVAQDGLQLIRQEFDLARQETIEKFTPAVQSGGMILGGSLLATIGSTYLADAVVRALATRMPHWLASLVFGAGLMGGGALLALRGSRGLRNIDLVPEKTINSLKEDKEWLLDQIKSRLI